MESDLDSDIAKAIALRDKRLRFYAGISFLSLAAVASVSIYLLVLTFSEHVKDVTILLPALVCGFLVISFSFSALSLIWKKPRSIEDRYVVSVEGAAQSASFNLYQRALEQAAARAGAAAPGVTLLELPKVACLAFQERGKAPAIGLTRSILKAGLSADEADALMARQLALLSIDGQLRPWQVEKIVWTCALPVIGLAFASGLASMFSRWWSVAVVMFCAAIALRMFLFPFLEQRFTDARGISEFVADALAMRTSINPTGLAGALRKLHSAGLTRTLASRYSTEKGEDGQGFARGRGPDIQGRIAAIEAISEGDWKPFEEAVGISAP